LPGYGLFDSTRYKTKYEVTMNKDLPIFDGHNDALQSIYRPKNGEPRPFFERTEQGHTDLPRMHEGRYAGGFFAIFVPSDTPDDGFPGADAESGQAAYDLPLPPSIELAQAQSATMKGVAALFQLEVRSKGQIKVIRRADELIDSLRRQVIAMVLHFEGAEAIDPELNALHVFYQAGLRSLGLTWSRPNDFAHGVPFRFPHSPDTGPGLSDAGRKLVKACNQLGIMIDLAHINEKGFWDTAEISEAPLVATHAGVHALCPSTRNLTDKQLDAVGESGGVIGINFHVGFLREDGLLQPETPVSRIVDHIDYVVRRIGVEHVALGSDFDGAIMPSQLGDVAGMPKLIQCLRDRGYDDEALRKVTHENWVRVLRRTWI
jgi:membrane dipeptidase